MPHRDPPQPFAGATSLSPEEFAVRFQDSARVLWTVAAGILGDGSQVEDVLQEAAVIALGKLDQFEVGTHFAAWMGRVVRFVALNHARRGQRRRTVAVEPEALEVESGAGGPAGFPAAGDAERLLTGRGELRPDQEQFDDRVVAALDELKPYARACLLLKVVAGLDYQHIARVLEVPAGTAMSHVHRARRLLRERLEEGRPLQAGGEA